LFTGNIGNHLDQNEPRVVHAPTRWETRANPIVQPTDEANEPVTALNLLTHRAPPQAELDGLSDSIVHIDALLTYCPHVCERLKIFNVRVKQLVLDVLDIQLTWAVDQALVVRESLPIGDG
jgi:hypothetical protein